MALLVFFLRSILIGKPLVQLVEAPLPRHLRKRGLLLPVCHNASTTFALHGEALVRKPLLKLLPRLSLRKLLARYRLNQLPERLFSCALKTLVFPVCYLRLALVPAVLLRADPIALGLDLPKRVHISVVVERVPPKLLPIHAHTVGDDVNMRVVLVPVRRDVRLMAA